MIEDEPRYGWRGFMLDVSRHFFGVDDVLRLIDLAALYKVNVLHLHLTDDQGWRIPIARWPELTVAGAATQVGGGEGGFYTAADYARIVARATSHAITVVPEIDVPGHVNAALVAYPELGGGERPEPFTTWSSPGVSLDVGSEIAIRFLGDVVSELVALTPGDYIHLGGDEVEGMDHDAYVGSCGTPPRSSCATARRRSCGRRPAWPSCPRARSSSTGPMPRPPAPAPPRACR